MSQSTATAPGSGAAIETFGSGPGVAVIDGGGLSAKKERTIVTSKARHLSPTIARSAFVQPFAERW
jgi:hypothetical protein